MRAALVGTVLAAGLLVGCAPETDDVGSAATAAPSDGPTGSPEPPSTEAPPDPPPTTAAPTAAPTEPATDTGSAAEGAAAPEQVAIQHGDDVWGVFLAVSPSDDDAVQVEARARAEALGYAPSRGDLACDRGAPEALGLGSPLMASRVHFATEAEAHRFVDLYGSEVVGVARVTTLCLD